LNTTKGDTLTHYEVIYAGEGDFQDRDAYGHRVRVAADGVYLGLWVGAVDGRTIATLPLGTDLDHFHRKAIVATAERIRDLANHGELRSQWSQDVEVLPLGRGEIETIDLPPDADWIEPSTVLEFDT
jgi:hypothetical protein